MANPAPEGDDIPKLAFDVNQVGPVGCHWDEIDRLQREMDWFWTTYAHGHWVLLDPEAIREAFQTPELFSSVSEVAAEPDPSYTWIPTNVDPPEHVKFRQVLNSWFAPKSVENLSPAATDWCRTLVERIQPRSRCDFMADFASVYPTGVFLSSIGLPLSETDRFVEWVRAIFDNLRHPALADKLAAAMGEVREYFTDLIDSRRRTPLDPGKDFVSHLLQSRVDERLLTPDEILNMCVVLVMAGLETTSGQLSYMFHHLATHPEHRRRIIADPKIIPVAVEEFLRAHPIVLPGRKLTRDAEFHGCPMRNGDMVMLTIPAANRSPLMAERPTEVDFDRKGPNRHVAFGSGPHRCLGIHLARRELATALQVWHELIPEYRLEEGAELQERGGQLGLVSLPLVWSATG
jgi:cytochrome P450